MTNPAARAPLTRHITAVFRTATQAQIAGALDWYADAHEIAQALAVKNGVSIETSAGVIAALSPMMSWGSNVSLAARFLATPGGLTSGYLGLGLAKARAIVGGATPQTILTSDKIGAFYAGIVSAGHTNIVTVDRHAWDIATNTRHTDATRPKLSSKRYAAAAECYVSAARIISREIGTPLYAAQLQGIVWVTWRNRYYVVGAFDSHTVTV
jgi:hypothetical protein